MRNDPHIGTEHLLLGLVAELDVTSRVLVDAGFDTESGRRHLEVMTPVRPWATTGHIPFTPRAKRAFQESMSVSDRLGQNHIAPPHLLCGLLAVPDAGGVRLLSVMGVDVATLAARAEELALANEADDGHRGGGERITGSFEPSRGLSGRRVQQQRDLRTALVRYGRHEEGCDPDNGCTCGLARVLSDDGKDDGA